MQQKLTLKNVTHVDVSGFASKTNLASLKTEVDKLEITKLTPVPDDLATITHKIFETNSSFHVK